MDNGTYILRDVGDAILSRIYMDNDDYVVGMMDENGVFSSQCSLFH